MRIRKDTVKNAFVFIVIVFIGYIFIKNMIIPTVLKYKAYINERRSTDTKISAREFDKLKYKSEIIEEPTEAVMNEIFKSINDDLIKDDTTDYKYDDITNFYELQPYFLEYRLYLSSKYKVKEALKELPTLIDKTKNLSESGIETYYKNNSQSLDNIFGIEKLDEFKSLVETFKYSDIKDVQYVCQPSTIYHNSQTRTITMYCICERNDDYVVGFNLQFKPYYSTENQSEPYVKILGMAGGVS